MMTPLSSASDAQSSAGSARPGHPEVTQASVVVAAIGVVFGDIGTSPLYTIQECVQGTHGVPPTPDNVLGIVSLIVWSVFLVVTVKYLSFLMRADNHGEGGIFSLLALVPASRTQSRPGHVGWLSALVMAGACLLFGDGIITPAISVLSALQGLKVALPGMDALVVPLTCAVLAVLFAVQRNGTGKVGRFFGPVMMVWFTTIGLLGAWHVFQAPGIVAAFLPPTVRTSFLSTAGTDSNCWAAWCWR